MAVKMNGEATQVSLSLHLSGSIQRQARARGAALLPPTSRGQQRVRAEEPTEKDGAPEGLGDRLCPTAPRERPQRRDPRPRLAGLHPGAGACSVGIRPSADSSHALVTLGMEGRQRPEVNVGGLGPDGAVGMLLVSRLVVSG